MGVEGHLESVFSAVWAGRRDPAAPDAFVCTAEVFDRLGALVEAAKGAARDFPLDDTALVRFVAERTSQASHLDVARAGDFALASACAAGSPRALAVALAKIRAEIGPSVRKLKLGETDVEAALQRVATDLFVTAPDRPAGITRYDGRGDLMGWLRVAAVRAGLKVIRGHRHDLSVEDEQLGERIGSAGDDPDLAYLKAAYRPMFQEAFQEALAALSPRDRTLLKQSLIDGLPIDALAGLYQVHRATAARWVAAARERLVVATRERFQARANASPEECESLFRAVRTNLDLTLRNLIAS